MSLRLKIFISFSLLFSSLLGCMLYILTSRVVHYEVTHLSQELSREHKRFHNRLGQEQRQILKLVKTVIQDQKFRSFLSQIKENFYSFTEEIVVDTETNCVIMVDENHVNRGFFPLTQKKTANIIIKLSKRQIQAVLDHGREEVNMVVIDNQLLSIVYLPLKEFLSDDYASGVLMVCKIIDNQWLETVLLEEEGKEEFRILFFSGNRILAGNMDRKIANSMIRKMEDASGEIGDVTIFGERYITYQGVFNNLGMEGRYIYSSNLGNALRPFRALQKNILLAGLGVLSLGFLLSILFSNRIVGPLKKLTDGTQQIINGNYDLRIERKSNDELGVLSHTFNLMVKGLNEKKFLQDSFGKYVHPSIVEAILKNPNKLKLGGERRNQTVLFCDIADFTMISEKIEPEKIIDLLNRYFGVMGEEILKSHGILDKFIGDAIMAFWGPPICQGNYTFQACTSAINMQKRIKSLRPQWIDQGFPEIKARFGIATGKMIVGNVGSEHAQEYTCIGDTVNFSSRLEGVNKYYKTEIIIDDNTRKNVAPQFLVRELDTIRVKGKQIGNVIYELMGLENEATTDQRWIRDRYEIALKEYRFGDFKEAGEQFERIYSKISDLTSKMMGDRCREYQNHRPHDWDGVFTLYQK